MTITRTFTSYEQTLLRIAILAEITALENERAQATLFPDAFENQIPIYRALLLAFTPEPAPTEMGDVRLPSR